MTKIFITSITLLLMFTNLAKAHYSVQDTGELLREHQWQFLTELQFKTSEDTGANGIIRLDKGFDEDSNLRFEFGAGTTDYELGGFYKWVPFPDFDRQPAIGFSIGAHFAHYEDETEMAARFVPFAPARR